MTRLKQLNLRRRTTGQKPDEFLAVVLPAFKVIAIDVTSHYRGDGGTYFCTYKQAKKVRDWLDRELRRQDAKTNSD